MGFTIENEVTIKSIEKDSEAESAGLNIGDKIKYVNGHKTRNLTLSSVEKLIRKHRKRLTMKLLKKTSQINQSKVKNLYPNYHRVYTHIRYVNNEFFD